MSTLLNFTFSDENIYRDNTLLFSLYKDIEPLDINEFHKTNYIALNDFLQNHNIIKIEPWLKSATEKDFDGDIYLNRIYRAFIDDNENVDNVGVELGRPLPSDAKPPTTENLKQLSKITTRYNKWLN